MTETLKTERLLLRRLRRDDAAPVAALVGALDVAECRDAPYLLWTLAALTAAGIVFVLFGGGT